MQDDLSGFQRKLSQLDNQEEPPVRFAMPLCVTLDRGKTVEGAASEDFEFDMLKISELIQQEDRLHGVIVEIHFEMETPHLVLLCNS